MQNTIIVPDCSFYDGKTDFVAMKNAGAKAVIIRVGQKSYVDSKFVEYWKTSKGILLRSAYWFYDSRYEPLAQAQLCAQLLIDNGIPEMELWGDYEETYNGPYAGWKHFSVFMAELEKLLPTVKLGVYTGYYYF